jgi:hypothetical protein
MTQDGVNRVPLGAPMGTGGRYDFAYHPESPVKLFDRNDGSYLHPSPSATAEHCITFWSNVEIPDDIISQTEEVYRADRDQEVDDDMTAAMASWTDEWADANPEGKKTPRSTDERNAKYRSEHEAYRLSILPEVEAKRPLAMGSYDSRQLIRAYQMVVNRPNPDKFPEESEKVLNHEMQLFDEVATIRDIHLKYQLHRIGGNIKGQVKIDEGQAVLDAIGHTNQLLAGISTEIVRQDIAANY